jgi:hypothetical protein
MRREVVFRQCPLTARESESMREERKGHAALQGVRGRPPVDRTALVARRHAVSRFGAAAGSRLGELGLNPGLLSARGAVAVDFLLVLNQPPSPGP